MTTKLLALLAITCSLPIRAASDVIIEDTRVSESQGFAEVRVLRQGDAKVNFSVDYKTIARTAPPSVNFVPQSGTLIFAAGEMEKRLRISFLDGYP